MKKDNLHKNNAGFKLPESYFESLEKKLSKKIVSDIKEEQPSSIKNGSGFKVPNGYFDSLEDTLTQKLNDGDNKGKTISLFSKRNLSYISGIAAMIAIIISVFMNKENDPLQGIDNIELADIQDYFIEGNIDLSNDEMAFLINEETKYSDFFEEKVISEEELLEYLSDKDLVDEIILTD